MNKVTLSELQQQSAALLDRVQAGGHLVVIRDGRPVAELRPVESPALKARPRGHCAGQFVVPDDFDVPLPEEVLRHFEGG